MEYEGSPPPPPPPPEQPPTIARPRMHRVRSVILVGAGLLVGSGVGGFVIAQAASSVAGSGAPSSYSSVVQAATTTPAPSATAHPCPHSSSGSSSTSGA